MKRKLILFTSFLVAVAAGFSSCGLDDDDGLNNFWIGYATVELREETSSGAQPRFDLLLDDDTFMVVSASYVIFENDYELKDGARVIANFTILQETQTADGQKQYYIRLNALQEILSKKPVYSSTADENEIGNDPIDVLKTWFGGKYLNVNFNYYKSNSEIRHFINLWVNEDHPNADEDNVYVEMRHNAYGDAPYNQVFGRVSFDLSDFLADDKESITVHFSYTDYDGKTSTESGIFKRKNIESVGQYTGGIGEDIGNFN